MSEDPTSPARVDAATSGPTVSIVVPCYRSAATLTELIDRLVEVLTARAAVFEIVLVVDGSPDDTWPVARKLAEAHSAVHAMRLSRNYGQHNALLAGIREARHDLIVTMDDDLQHRPEDVPVLLDALTDEVDLVYGISIEEEHNPARNVASRALKSTMARVMRVPHATKISAFRAFRARLRDGFVNISGAHISIDVALSWTTTRIVSTDVEMEQRETGRSNYSFRTLARHALTMILGYSSAPLRLVTYLGFVCGLLGCAVLLYVLVMYLTGITRVPGFTTLASMVAIFSGAQMVAIGVVGEYLARVHTRSMGRPAYVISHRTDA